jgi:hypothetical protein
MSSEVEEGKVLVFRNSASEPIAVPGEIVTEAERAYRCHIKRLEGSSWEEIAIAEKYPTAIACKADVDRYLKEGAALVTEKSQRDQLTLEVGRLDAMQLFLWPKAKGGSVPAVTAIVNIIMNRSKLVGLQSEQALAAGGPRTLVVPVDDEGFLDALKEAAAASARPIQPTKQGAPDVTS